MNKISKSKSDGNVCNDIFVGMDLQKSCLQVAILDGNGKVLRNSGIDNNLSKIGKFFDPIGASVSNDTIRVIM